MTNITITIRIPALGNSFDFIVPNNMSVKDAQSLIIQILSSEYGVPNIGNEVTLFDTDDGKALRLECSFAQLGISDGAKLLLI